MEQDNNVKLFKADDALRGVLIHFYNIFQPAGSAIIIKNISSSLKMLLIFNFSPDSGLLLKDERLGEHIIRKLAVIGPLSKMLNYELEVDAYAIVVNFMLDGFCRFYSGTICRVEHRINYLYR